MNYISSDSPETKSIRVNTINAISIQGKRWFQKTYGSTYNSVTIEIVTKDWSTIIYLPSGYGYGDYYFQRAKKELYNRIILDCSENLTLRYLRDEKRIPIFTSAIDVSRKKDL